MKKLKNAYFCQNCGYESSKWIGKCPGCNEWNTFVEEKIQDVKLKNEGIINSKPMYLKEVEIKGESRIGTNIGELDRVLGGGIVQGSLILISGDPGIGKSTLLLQICEKIEKNDNSVLYVSGEESVNQVKLRAERLGIFNEKLLLYSEVNLELIVENIKKINPSLVIIDSIQTIFSNEVSSAPGSVSQVREATGILLRIAKETGISIIIVGHVTKEGSIAGPRVLEHMVDVVLYFEGERNVTYRILRTVKNRYGSTNEIGVFEMKNEGLIEVENPSQFMLSGRPTQEPGSIITGIVEGTRPMLLEIQALASYTNFGIPRRTANGIDYNRVVLLIAVLEKKMGINLTTYDVYVNLTGGMKINEPSLDLAIITSIYSSYKNQKVDSDTVVFGEVGLTGEVRAVNMAEKRVIEAEKMGFKVCILPEANKEQIKSKNIKVYGVKTVTDIFEILFKK